MSTATINMHDTKSLYEQSEKKICSQCLNEFYPYEDRDIEVRDIRLSFCSIDCMHDWAEEAI